MAIMDGKAVAAAERAAIGEEARKLREQGYEHGIGLAVILVGDNQASKVYVRNKINACAEVGINSFLVEMPASSTHNDVLTEINRLNGDAEVSGIILQLPLPKGLDEAPLLDAISPDKDVDGCHYVQKGRLWTGRDSLIACTPLGVMRLLDYYDIDLEGKNAVVIGRSNLVGKPLAQLLLDRNATVTICHSRSRNLKDIASKADVLCVAIGRAKFVTADMVKEGAVVIDVGMDRDENNKLCGDVDFEAVKDKASFITPVPGGVGPMTVTMLISNTVKAYKIQNGIA